MAGSEQNLALLAELAGTVARMTQLARERRWDQLPALDAQCGQLVDRLRGLDPDALGSADRSRVLALAARVRADQEELTRLLRPQFLHLVRRMGDA
jgi:hypothetical protein